MNELKGMTRLGMAATLVAASMTAAMAQDQGVTDDTILLGEVLPLTGAAAVGALALSAGHKLAVLEQNAAGGLHGRMLEIVQEDDGYVVPRGVQGVRKMLTSEQVFAMLVTSNTAVSSATVDMLTDMGIPTMNYLSFPEVFYEPVKDNIFVGGASHRDTTFALMQMMNEEYPDKKWAIVTGDSELGFQMREGIDPAVEEFGINVVYNETYRGGQKDFSAEMVAANNAGAEVLFAGGIVSENIAMVKEMERLGNDAPVVLSWIGRYAPAFLAPMGEAVKNVHMVDYVVADESPEGMAFMEKASEFLEASDMEKVNRFSMVGYASTKVLLNAIGQCADLTWTCVNDALEATTDFEVGVMSPISYSAESHFTKQDLQLMRVNPETLNYVPIGD